MAAISSQHGETEGALRGRSATVQELDFAQTSSYEDARLLSRKADGTQKAGCLQGFQGAKGNRSRRTLTGQRAARAEPTAAIRAF